MRRHPQGAPWSPGVPVCYTGFMKWFIPLALLGGLVVGYLAGAGGVIGRPAPVNPPSKTVSVILVRHAEKESGKDPGLTDRGRARSEEIVKMLSQQRVSHVFATEYRRTADTVAPLAGEHKAEVEIVSAREPAALAQRITKLPDGSTAVVAGHSNTLSAIAAALGADPFGDLDESDYDNLFILTLGADRPSLLRLRFAP